MMNASGWMTVTTEPWGQLRLRTRTRSSLAVILVSIALVLASSLNANANGDPNPAAVVVTWQTEDGRPVAGQKIVLMAAETPESGPFVPIAKAVTDTAGTVRFDALTGGRRYMLNPGYPFNDLNWGWTARPGVTESFVLPAIPLDRVAIWSRGAEARWVKDDKYGYALLNGITWNCFAPASMPADTLVHLTISDDFGAILLNNVDGYTCPSGSASTWGGSTSHTCGVLPAFTQPLPSNPTWMYHPSYPEHEIKAYIYTWTLDTPDGPYIKSTTVPVDASICPARPTPKPTRSNPSGGAKPLRQVRNLGYRSSPHHTQRFILHWKPPVNHGTEPLEYRYKYARVAKKSPIRWTNGATKRLRITLKLPTSGVYRVIVRAKAETLVGPPRSLRIRVQ